MNKKPGFYWNPNYTEALTQQDRHSIALHERLHLEYSKTRGRISEAEYSKLLAQIKAMENGEPCPEPMTDNICEMVRPKNVMTDEEADRRVRDALNEKWGKWAVDRAIQRDLVPRHFQVKK